MYGQKKYGRTRKPIKQPIVDNSTPTFICPHCGLVKTVDNPHIEITALENGKLFMYTKICKDCSGLLKDWIKG